MMQFKLTGTAIARSAVLCFVVLGPVPHAAADETAQAWFERMNYAVENLNYRGTFVHLRENRIDTLDVLHKVENDLVFERMTSRSGPPREFIRNGDEVHCIVESRKEVLVDRGQQQNPLVATLPVFGAELSKNYDLRFAAHNQPVAGRNTVYIGIVPKDGYRYGYRMWLDEETAMPLVCEMVDNDGKLIETLHFTSIEFNPEFSPTAFEPTMDTQDFRWIDSTSKQAAVETTENHWVAGEVPRGFALSISNVEEAGDKRVEHYVYSDGLAMVSVFAERRAPGEQEIRGARSLGVTNAFGRVEGDYQITVVGEVPLDTVKIIGNSFRPK
ncbi:MAG: hypothetical protein HKN70_08865 [Gammaproteobacteria bacterium]|nr:hypothetical protein [Gammaproteobacteria bacterium]